MIATGQDTNLISSILRTLDKAVYADPNSKKLAISKITPSNVYP